MASVRRLAAIMFTDTVGFTASAQTNEADALQLLHEQEELIRPVFTEHHGREIKSTGDGFLVEFGSALRAVECAIDIQQRLHRRNSRPGARPLQIRVGVHLGDVEERGSDILGDAVNIAARIEPLAVAGGICISGPVFDQVRNKIPNDLEKLEPKSLKNVRFPIDVYRVMLPWSDGRITRPAGAPARLAVLPLVNISPDPNDEYFADGLTEELISVLSQIRGIRVIARTSVSQYKGTAKPIAQIGSELGVGSVLEGSVRKADHQLRISMQLIDVRTEEHRWAMTYDRKLENIFAIQADVAERTADALQIELLNSEREAIQEHPTSSLAAYESYLRGIQAFQRLAGIGGVDLDREAVSHFEKAIREDPKFSAAYSYLANHLIATMGITRSGKEVFPRARELVEKALELNPNSSDAHTAQGNLAMQMDLDWARAESEYQRAISLNPSASSPHFWYGLLLVVLQRFNEAEEQSRLAVELDPLWLLPRLNLASTLEALGRLDEAVALVEGLQEGFAGVPAVRTALAGMYVEAGRANDALALLEPLKGSSEFTSRASRAGLLALLGKTEEARALMADIDAGKLGEYVPVVARVFFCTMTGETERALDVLEQDYREGDKILWNFYRTEFLDPLRDNPRFVALLHAMNLPTSVPKRRVSVSGGTTPLDRPNDPLS
ncbi:MAG TPA: adenylate/guanylate cyclase domain-containing protein [Thermoplasmata archaeon]|nr:adenylate/guanylate cyclase domain-containing protein [Thermoplasmata archaeon]